MLKNIKKIFTVVLVLTAAGIIHAEVTIGASVDMEIIPFQLIFNEGANENRLFGTPEQNEMIFGAGAGRYGSGQGVRARLDARYSHETIFGLRARMQVRPDGVAIEDYLQAWWNITPWLRLDAGRFFDDRLRGKVNDLDERMNANTVRMYDADAIFSRFRTHRYGGQAGLMISATPIDNLFIGALLYDLKPFTASSSSVTDSAMYNAHPDYITDNADAWQRVQAAIAYTIPKAGIIRVQYLGVKPMVEIKRVSDEVLSDSNQILYSYMFDTFSITAPRIEAAFALTEITGLTIDIGGKYPLPFKNWNRSPSNVFEKEDEALLDAIYKNYKNGFVWQAPIQASLGFKISPPGLEILEIAGRVDGRFAGYMKGHIDEMHFAPEINAHIWPSVDLSFARIIINAGFEYIGAAYNKNGDIIGMGTAAALNGGYRIGTGISLQKNLLGNSFVKIGVAYKFEGTVNSVKEKAVLTVPLYLEFNL